MSDLPGLIRALRWLCAAAVLFASAALGAQAFAHENTPLLAGCSLIVLVLLFPVSHALAEGVEELWRWNEERSLLPAVARDVLRVINRHLMQLSRWKDSDNARRGAFDPAVETLIEQGRLSEARWLAAEKLWSAHCSGQTKDERMYRRYMYVVDSMRKAA